jgi:hypothetical protein
MTDIISDTDYERGKKNKSENSNRVKVTVRGRKYAEWASGREFG